jgi:uncharacterized protein (TIGR02444 family)
VRLWDFAVAIHGEPGVDAGLIDLQDNHGQCVSYLLWAVWAARHGRAVSEAELTLAAGLARDWEAEVGGPLRATRRALKRPRPPMADAGREALRATVKANELSAERTLLEALEALTPKPTAPYSADVAQRLHAAMAAWSGSASISGKLGSTSTKVPHPEVLGAQRRASKDAVAGQVRPSRPAARAPQDEELCGAAAKPAARGSTPGPIPALAILLPIFERFAI